MTLKRKTAKDLSKKKREQSENVNIHNQCFHKFEDDYIDITPDKGMNITYCVHCMLTKK